MKIGIRSPLTGLIASAPSATPVFSRSVDRRSISVRIAAWATYASTSAFRSGAVSSAHERVLGGEDHERRPEQGVRAGREDAQLGAARVVVGRGGVEDDLAALAPPDPVGLLGLDRFRPLQAAEVEELVGVLGDLEVPLGQVALLDLRAAAPAMAVDALDLLPGEGPVVGAPVDRRGLAVGEARLQELEEEPLVPAVVVGIGGDDLRLPVERRAHRPQLAAHVVDVRHRPVARVDAVLDRGVLGRQSERIEADRQEHVLAVHPMEAGDRVGRRDDVPVADVDVARRIRVHRQQVELAPLGVVEVRPIHAELGPARLPARLDRRRVVALGPDAGFAGVRSRLSSETVHPPPRRRGVRDRRSRRGWWSYGDSNPGPPACHAGALPAEL